DDVSLSFDARMPSLTRLTTLPVATKYQIIGPTVSLQRLQRLAVGDLLLISAQPAAQLAAGGSAWAGRLDLETRPFTLND
ncbi:hypothetical protein, partial [Staphylococcus aureus]|uniref:hypothetical protein n=1 Tax=Staphylococcus aureus TaxID=1280 RepID=UPI001A933EEB